MTRAPALVIGVALLLAGAAPVFADSSYQALGTRTDEHITIDGDMSEPAWQRAQKLGDWHQTRIKIGAPAQEPTEARILYDRDNLYFGFHCYDSRPDKIAAYTVQNEAFLHQDDNVTVIIDTYLDHRNAYYFWTNPLGVRTDGRIVNDGENFNTDWQGEWEAKGRIVKDGWVVEIRIPFSNFQYNNLDEHTFGILLDREQVRLQEWSNWTPDGVNSAKVSRYPHLGGLRGIAPRSILGITAYMSGQVTVADGPQASFFGGAGVDLRYSPSTWATLKLTVNPDFAQVDVDQDVLWLDVVQRSLPERRPFFLEGGELFISPIRLFYSRRIAPLPIDRVLVGLQAVGKKDGFGFSILDVQSQEHRPDGSIEDVNSAIVRVQRDIRRRSQISAILLGRFGDSKLGVLGLDTNISLYEEIFFLGQFAVSAGPDTGLASDKIAGHAELHRFTTNAEFWLQYDDIGASFQSPLGYIPYTDVRSIYAHGNYTWFTPWKSRFVPRVDFSYDEQWWWAHDGEKKRENRNFSITPYIIDDLSVYFYGQMDYYQGFNNLFGNAGLTLFPNRWDSISLTAAFGNLYGGSFAGFKAAINRKFGAHIVLRLSTFATWSAGLPTNSPLYKGSPDGFQWSVYGQLRYQFTPNLYARVTYQRGSAVDLTDLGQIEGQIVDATIGWHYRVGSDAFLVYTQQPVNGQQLHRVLLKVSYSL